MDIFYLSYFLLLESESGEAVRESPWAFSSGISGEPAGLAGERLKMLLELSTQRKKKIKIHGFVCLCEIKLLKLLSTNDCIWKTYEYIDIICETYWWQF